MYDQRGDCNVCENNLILSPFNWTDVHSALIKNTENIKMNQDGLQPRRDSQFSPWPGPAASPTPTEDQDF